MGKRFTKRLAWLMALLLCLGMTPALAVDSQPDLLLNLEHNAPHTGIMQPDTFSPHIHSYLLTVADWVSRITLTPTVAQHHEVRIQGEKVESGKPSGIIRLSNEPVMVRIQVTAYDASGKDLGLSEYIVFIQRRPSERRTRVSAGYISEVSLKNGLATISADLVTLSYQANSNLSSFINDTVYMYRYDCAPNCLFFFGSPEMPRRARTPQEFIDNYLSYGKSLYYLVYIEDRIVAVFPYAPD